MMRQQIRREQRQCLLMVKGLMCSLQMQYLADVLGYKCLYLSMDLFSFMKQKSNTNINKGENKVVKNVRMDTEATHMVNKKNKTNKINDHEDTHHKPQLTQKIERNAAHINLNHIQSSSTLYQTGKTAMKIKQLRSILSEIRQRIQTQYQYILNHKMHADNYKEIICLLSTNYFRYKKINFQKAMDEYSNIISALELLISKLNNNQLLPQQIMVRDEQDFVLFFKLFFSKPYNLINMHTTRKIIKLLWDRITFHSLTLPATINHLRLWIFGIASPINPSMNRLHQYVVDRFEEISRLVNHKSNNCVYIGVNESDAIGLTPLMVATITNNIKGMEKLIKNGASLYVCPLTYNVKMVVQSVQESKFGKKTMYRKDFGIRERRQGDVIQILRNQKRIDELGQLLCWKSFYDKKKVKKDQQLSDFMLSFPDCSFQIDWRQYKGMLCFKELPQDIISIYKRDYSLRVDFHIKSLQNYKKAEREHYSIILKSQPKKQNKLYLIAHNKKLIINLLQDKNLSCIKEQFNNILKHGNIYNAQISEIKAIFIPEQNRLTATLNFYYQNIIKFHIHTFESLKEYLSCIMKSDTINYKEIEKNQLAAVLQQKITAGEKVKSKVVEQTASIDIEWADESLNISHLDLVLRISSIAFPSSLTLNKITHASEIFNDPIFRQKQLKKKLPLRCKYSFNTELNIQSELKNLKYSLVQESVFNVQIKAKQQRYKQMQDKVDLSHLQDTVFIDETYSINASRFIGQSENILQFEEQEANKKFEMLLKLQGLWINDEQQEQK